MYFPSSSAKNSLNNNIYIFFNYVCNIPLESNLQRNWKVRSSTLMISSALSDSTSIQSFAPMGDSGVAFVHEKSVMV